MRGGRGFGETALTRESFKPSLAASFLRSGLLMYFCFWNILSSALRCTSEDTSLRSMPRRGLPRVASGQEKVPGMGTTLEDAAEARGARTAPARIYLWQVLCVFWPTIHPCQVPCSLITRHPPSLRVPMVPSRHRSPRSASRHFCSALAATILFLFRKEESGLAQLVLLTGFLSVSHSLLNRLLSSPRPHQFTSTEA